MGVRIEWALIRDLELITDPEDCMDEHGTSLDFGNVAVGAAGCVIEGKPAEVAAKLRELADEADAFAKGES